jgi:hypothetical protein
MKDGQFLSKHLIKPSLLMYSWLTHLDMQDLQVRWQHYSKYQSCSAFISESYDLLQPGQVTGDRLRSYYSGL